MSVTHQDFDECFQQAFDEGMSDIKFFVRRSLPATVAELEEDALAFQSAIRDGRVRLVEAVD